MDVCGVFPKIGSDEVGKGDFFGPLVVCAVYAAEPGAMAERVTGDSKTVSDRRVMQLAPELQRMAVHSVVRISPEKYNDLYRRFHNINIILGWAHAQAIKNVLGQGVRPKAILIDQFGPEFRVMKHFDNPEDREKFVFMNRAEADVAVAAASLIARYVFLNEMKALSRECGLDLPLGAGGAVDAAAGKLAEKIGMKGLSRFVKTHFKNFSRLG